MNKISCGVALFLILLCILLQVSAFVSAFGQEEASLAERMAKVEGILEQMDKRLNHIESDIKSLEAKIESLRQEIKQGETSLRQEIKQGDASLKQEIKQGDASLKQEIKQGDAALRDEIREIRSLLLVILLPMWITIILTIASLFGALLFILKKQQSNNKKT